MPPSAETMDTARGMQEAPPKMEEKPEWWASPAVVGLMGFGTTTMLAGLANLPLPYGGGFSNNATVYGMAMAFGGTAQFAAGLIALRKGNMFAGSAFVGYGSFWWAFTLMLLWYNAGGSAVTLYGLAGFAFIWMMFTLSFMINAPKHGWGITGVFVLLWIAFILLTVKFYSLAGSDASGCSGLATVGCGPFAANAAANWAVGGEIILTGLLAWYVATADLTNWNYGRKLLPA